MPATRKADPSHRDLDSCLYFRDPDRHLIEVATAGKTGVHFFENLRIDNVPKAEREKEILLDKNWPFPGEGQVVKQDNEPKK
jgi:hypothetical protein